ncbi:MAG: DUF3617 domain-containing protein [Sutterellaceae bacterium]|nr:DUF3617 domain-containing protein [Burkholderiaceae bacterium]MDW8430016.1 DUF3617 domain-containing protein [Sutterellaceae bacterium]
MVKNRNVFQQCIAILLGFSAALGHGAVQATQVRPGLWEVTIDFPDNPEIAQAHRQMQENLKKMPPEQRRMMEEIVANQTGVQWAGAGQGSRICLSKAAAERDELPLQMGMDCVMQRTPRHANVVRLTFTCKNPPQTGEAVYTIHNPQHYTMELTSTIQDGGRSRRMRMKSDARWISADCGELKPIGESRTTGRP